MTCALHGQVGFSPTRRAHECVTGAWRLGIGRDGQAVCSPIKTPTFTACRTGLKYLYWHKFDTPQEKRG